MTSRARQPEQAGVLVAGHGTVAAGFSGSGESRTLPWARRPQAAEAGGRVDWRAGDHGQMMLALGLSSKLADPV